MLNMNYESLFVLGVTYNIPVCIWLQENHPYVPPLVFVKPTNTMAIKTSQHVDSSGKVYHPYIHEWTYVCSKAVMFSVFRFSVSSHCWKINVSCTVILMMVFQFTTEIQQLNAIFVALKLQLQNRTCKPLCNFGMIFAIYRRGTRYNSRNTVTLSSSFTF